MAKKIVYVQPITKAADLVTSREKTRAGFISIALEKNYLAVPFIEEAKILKALAGRTKKPIELIKMTDIRVGLLTASRLSDKSLGYLTEEDKTIAIQGLVDKFLIPAGNQFVDELVYRYLLIKGDTLGGKIRNIAGTFGGKRFMRALISVFNLSGIKYYWKDSQTNAWAEKPDDDSDLEKRACAFAWKVKGKNRLLLQNIKVPIVDKNVDLCLFNASVESSVGKLAMSSLIRANDKYIALGELKGGIDPAGADEHWKTANSAINRIRKGFSNDKLSPKTFFIGAAIEQSMAVEIFAQLQNKTLTNAANLSNEDQLAAICDWLIGL